MFIRTERLLLRPTWPEDLDELLELLSEDEIRQNLGIQAMPETRDELRAQIIRPRTPMMPNFFIYLRDNRNMPLLGGIGLGPSADDVELGYWIAKRYRGKGYAEEAVRALLSQARALGHRKIVAHHFADNPATGAVLEKAGFVKAKHSSERYAAERGAVAPTNYYVADLAAGLAQQQAMAMPSPQAS